MSAPSPPRAAAAAPLHRRLLIGAGVAVAVVSIGVAWERGAASAAAQVEDAELFLRMQQSTPPAGALGSGGTPGVMPEAVRRAVAALPPYKDAVPQPLADMELGPGVPFAVAWFATKDPPQVVLDYYRETLLDGGFPVVHGRLHENAGYVGHMDPLTEEMHMISVLAQGGETLVFASAGEVGKVLGQQQQVPAGLPHPPSAQGTMVMRFRDEGGERVSVVAKVPGARVTDVVDFYRREFAARQWAVSDVRDVDGEVQVVARQGSTEAIASLRNDEGAVRVYLLTGPGA